MTGIYAIIGIVMLVFGILQIVLFFKLWGMTNDVGQMGTLVVHTATWQQMRIKEITPDHKYVCTQGNLVRAHIQKDV